MTTPAQEEFNALVANNTKSTSRVHPEDRRPSSPDSLSEEAAYQESQVDAAMRMPAFDRAAADLKLPPASFDSGRSTGVKGVIADARSYEAARRTKWTARARRSIFGLESSAVESSEEEESTHGDGDEESFLAQWRESRKLELESESGKTVRNRRTSPSVRIFGRLDEVDALGYLDAIEKVSRETIVVVYVYDPEVCPPLTSFDKH